MSEKKQIFQFHGTKAEKEDFHAICDMLADIPAWKKLMDAMIARGKVCGVEFDKTLDHNGEYQTGKEKILLYPFADAKWADKKTYLQSLLRVFGHEVTHAVTADYYIQMIQNAVHLNEVLMATLLSEATATLVEKQLSEGNQELTAIQKKGYVLDVLTGRKGWVWPYIKRTCSNYNAALHHLSPTFQTGNGFEERMAIVMMQKNRFPMPQIPNSRLFDEAMSKMIKIIDADMSVGDVREIRVPLKRPTKLQRYIQNLELGRIWREFVMRHK